MKCAICNKTFIRNISFNNFFKISFICKDCVSLVELKKCLIPLKNGYELEYYFCLLDESYKEEVRKKANQKIYKLLEKNQHKVFLYFEEEEIPYIQLFDFCQNTILFTVCYFELENLIK